jgi:hypothetical protein
MLNYVIAKSIPTVLGFGTMLAVITATLDYTGNQIRGGHNPNVDQYSLKEATRKNFRIPAEETVAQLGEGRGMCLTTMSLGSMQRLTKTGIYGPGYDERRKQRLKEKYGIDVAERPF